MRITQEADYALRIAYLLAQNGGMMDSDTISESVGVTARFTIKILRKLSSDGIIKSRKGVNGGYEFIAKPQDVSMLRIVEIIDGPLEISKCLGSDYECTRTGNNKHKCTFHIIFSKINQTLSKRLDSVTLDKIIAEDFDMEQLLSGL